ncbi:MAG: TonB-dependent receptor [Blastocatellia bacterium]|nr:TonB-dependent receptor [Blastocatellia bacterium]
MKTRKFWIKVIINTAFLILAICNLSGLAQLQRADLGGTVTDSAGNAVVGAVVVVKQLVSNLEREVVTDESGKFEFSNLPSGSYRLQVTSAGFSTFSQQLSIAASSVQRNVKLQVGAIAEAVTVTADRTELAVIDTPVAVNVVSREKLEQQGINTVGDIFRILPGVATASEGPFQVRPKIRGLDSNRVLVLVDGERLNNTRTSTSESGIETGLVGVDQIETVEVVRGSGSVLYGTDALGGTINIITKDTLARQTSGLRFTGGFNGLFSSNETGRRGTANIGLAARAFAIRFSQTLDRFSAYSSGANQFAQNDLVANSQYHGSSSQLTGRLFINDLHSVKISYDRYRAADIGVANVTGTFNAFFPFSDRDKISIGYSAKALTPTISFFSAKFYHQQQKRNFSNLLRVPGFQQFSQTVTDTETNGYDIQTNFLLGSRNLLTAGTSYFRDSNRDSRLIRTAFGSISREDRSKSLPNASFSNFALFAQNSFQLNPKFKFVSGIRFDRFSISSERTSGFDLPAFFTPSQIAALRLDGAAEGVSTKPSALTGDIGLVFKPTEKLSATVRVGRSFRQPNLFERFFTNFGSAEGFVVGNRNLEPESGINLDIGLKFRTAKATGSVTYFNNNYRNFLSNQRAVDQMGKPISVNTGSGRPEVAVFQTMNVGRTRIQGFESELEYSHQVNSILLVPSANLSYLRGDDLNRNQPLDFITPLKFVAGLRGQDLKNRYWTEISARIVTTQRRLSEAFRRANGGNEPGFAVYDLRTGINFRRENYTMSITTGLLNLANRFYNEQFVFAPARGRTLTVGLNLNFF